MASFSVTTYNVECVMGLELHRVVTSG